MGEIETALPLDSYIAILLFLIGVPALLFQMASNDVRRLLLLSRNLKRTLVLTILPATLGFALVTVAVFTHRILPENVNLEGLYESVIGILIILALFGSVNILRFVVKPLLIENTGWNARRQIRRRGAFNEHLLKDLVLLGLESRGGEEKDLVINEMQKVTAEMLAQPGYQGNQLGDLINALREVVLEGNERSSPENIRSSVELLQSVKQKYYACQRNGRPIADADLGAAYKVLSWLGQEAVRFSTDGAASACIDTLTGPGLVANPTASQGLREIGIAAIQRDKGITAMKALQPLDTLVFATDGMPEASEIGYDFLALLAFFWDHGPTARALARQILDELGQKPGLNLRALVLKAIAHHRQVDRFTITDKLARMWRQYRKLPTPGL